MNSTGTTIRIRILICKAENLPKTNLFTMPNGFVKIYSTNNKEKIFSTKIVQKKVAPEWNEHFDFEINPKKDQIVVSVWDSKKIEKDLKKSSNFKKLDTGLIGQLVLNESTIEKYIDKGVFLFGLEKTPQTKNNNLLISKRNSQILLKLISIEMPKRENNVVILENRQQINNESDRKTFKNLSLASTKSETNSCLTTDGMVSSSTECLNERRPLVDCSRKSSSIKDSEIIRSRLIEAEYEPDLTNDVSIDNSKSTDIHTNISRRPSDENNDSINSTNKPISNLSNSLTRKSQNFSSSSSSHKMITRMPSESTYDDACRKIKYAQDINANFLAPGYTFSQNISSSAASSSCSLNTQNSHRKPPLERRPSEYKSNETEHTLNAQTIKNNNSTSSTDFKSSASHSTQHLAVGLERSNSNTKNKSSHTNLISVPSFLKIPNLVARRKSSIISNASTTTNSLDNNNDPHDDIFDEDPLEKEKLNELSLKYKSFKRQIINYGSRVLILKLELNRDTLFEDSFCFLSNLKAKFARTQFLIKFKDEEGVDYGGVGKEWFHLLSFEIFNPLYGLFELNKQNNQLEINKHSVNILPDYERLYELIGKMIGMALYNGFNIDVPVSGILFKYILDEPINLLDDLKSIDSTMHKSLCWMLNNDITSANLCYTFTASYEFMDQVFTVELKENGNDIEVDESNKNEFIDLYLEWRLKNSIKKQLDLIIKGFFQIVPLELVKIFNSDDLQLIICGYNTIDINKWKLNSTCINCHDQTKQVRWFWKAVESFDTEKRMKLIQLVTGSARLPLKEFTEVDNEASNPFTIFLNKSADKNSLPTIHTCFNRIDLPCYESYEKLLNKLNMAIDECREFSVQ